MQRRPRSILGLFIHLARLRFSRRRALIAASAIAVAAAAAITPRARGDRREHHRELEALRHIDCPTPGCTREARGSGWMHLRADQRWYDDVSGEERVGMWYVECHCPRCGDTFERWTPEYQRLCERLTGG